MREKIQTDHTAYDIDYVSCGKTVKFRPQDKEPVTRTENDITFNNYRMFRSYEKTLPTGTYFNNGVDLGSNLFGFVPNVPLECPKTETWKQPTIMTSFPKSTEQFNFWAEMMKDFFTNENPQDIEKPRVQTEIKRLMSSIMKERGVVPSEWLSQKVSDIIWDSLGEFMYPIMQGQLG